MQSELADAKHELLKIQEMLEMAEKVTDAGRAALFMWQSVCSA